jgi:hypothetical protein
MRARYPDGDGLVARDGVGIRYERCGDGWPAILLLPAWSLVHSRRWKMQVPYLARHFTVVCFDLIAAHITELAGQPVSYRDVETDGAARAPRLIAELI